MISSQPPNNNNIPHGRPSEDYPRRNLTPIL
ncbi:unnamed protein product, partial [Adineta steineri]